MAKKEKEEKTDLAVQSSGGALAPAPDFAAADKDMGLESLVDYIVPPRLKVVQKMSGEEFEQFKVGTVIAVPQMLQVAGMIDKKKGEDFHFVPIFFYPEWVAWNPIKMQGSLNAIRERTTDPDDLLVAKCKNQKTWKEVCPENKEEYIRNVEHLNFILMLKGDHELSGTPLILSFARAAHKYGTRFAASLKMRTSAMFGCVFTGTSVYESNSEFNWFAIQTSNPSADSKVSAWINDKEEYEMLKIMHLKYKEAHAKALIRVDYDDVPNEPGDAKAAF